MRLLDLELVFFHPVEEGIDLGRLVLGQIQGFGHPQQAQRGQVFPDVLAGRKRSRGSCCALRRDGRAPLETAAAKKWITIRCLIRSSLELREISDSQRRVEGPELRRPSGFRPAGNGRPERARRRHAWPGRIPGGTSGPPSRNPRPHSGLSAMRCSKEASGSSKAREESSCGDRVRETTKKTAAAARRSEPAPAQAQRPRAGRRVRGARSAPGGAASAASCGAQADQGGGEILRAGAPAPDVRTACFWILLQVGPIGAAGAARSQVGLQTDPASSRTAGRPESSEICRFDLSQRMARLHQVRPELGLQHLAGFMHSPGYRILRTAQDFGRPAVGHALEDDQVEGGPIRQAKPAMASSILSLSSRFSESPSGDIAS